jgi:hypothetical protein
VSAGNRRVLASEAQSAWADPATDYSVVRRRAKEREDEEIRIMLVFMRMIMLLEHTVPPKAVAGPRKKKTAEPNEAPSQSPHAIPAMRGTLTYPVARRLFVAWLWYNSNCTSADGAVVCMQ